MKSTASFAEPELSKKAIELFEPDDGETVFVEHKSEWNTDMWQTMRVELQYNFSRLKFDRIISIMAYFREQGESYFQVPEKIRSQNDVNSNSLESKVNTSATNQATSYLVGGVSGAVILGVSAKLLGYSMASGFFFGALVGIGVVHANNKKD
jgi:hypothetical protein